jgi:hypothetical protein
MKKLYKAILALFAVSALGALLAASASAETTLGAEWLANGNAVLNNLSTESAGQLELEDTGAPGSPSVLCSGVLSGTVGAAGVDETKEVLNKAKESVSLTPLTGLALLGTEATGPDCVTERVCAVGSATSPIEVWPVGLPWASVIFTMEDGKILDLITKVGGGKFGYELLCLVGGINTVDECTSTDAEVELFNDPEGADAAIPAGAKTTPNAVCTLSGNKETGVNEADELIIITLLSGELLTMDAL